MAVETLSCCGGCIVQLQDSGQEQPYNYFLQRKIWLLLHILRTPPPPHSSPPLWWRSPELAWLDSCLWHSPTDLNTDLCWVSFPALGPSPRPSYFSVESIICFSHYQTLGKHTSAANAPIFPFTFSSCAVVIAAFKGGLLSFHILWRSVSLNLRCEICSEKTLTTLLHSLAIPELFFPLPSSTFRGSDFSPSNECRVIRTGKWKMFLDLGWKPLFFFFIPREEEWIPFITPAVSEHWSVSLCHTHGEVWLISTRFRA